LKRIEEKKREDDEWQKIQDVLEDEIEEMMPEKKPTRTFKPVVLSLDDGDESCEDESEEEEPLVSPLDDNDDGDDDDDDDDDDNNNNNESCENEGEKEEENKSIDKNIT
jgi:hypothetical protein